MQRKRRRIIHGILVLVAAMLVSGIFGLFFYSFPPQGNAEGADLSYVIGPPYPERLVKVQQLRASGGPTRILISVDPSSDSEESASSLPICNESGVTCGVPDPLKTRGEAAMLTDYAQDHTVHKTVVITFAPQVMRARFIFAKCYSGDFSVIYVDQHLTFSEWAYQYVYQTAGFLKAFVKPCPQ